LIRKPFGVVITGCGRGPRKKKKRLPERTNLKPTISAWCMGRSRFRGLSANGFFFFRGAIHQPLVRASSFRGGRAVPTRWGSDCFVQKDAGGWTIYFWRGARARTCFAKILGAVKSRRCWGGFHGGVRFASPNSGFGVVRMTDLRQTYAPAGAGRGCWFFRGRPVCTLFVSSNRYRAGKWKYFGAH